MHSDEHLLVELFNCLFTQVQRNRTQHVTKRQCSTHKSNLPLGGHDTHQTQCDTKPQKSTC